MNRISGFMGEYRFLSNFYSSPLHFNFRDYPTAEHAYQAAKTRNALHIQWIQSAPTPSEAKARGRKITVRDNWDILKVPVMYMILVEKFGQNPILKVKLLETENSVLVESNTWHDTVWGCCLCQKHKGEGQNQLGLLLMNVREKYQKELYG